MQVSQHPDRSTSLPSAHSKPSRYRSYLVTRGQTLYFRYVVPIPIRPLLGLSEIRRTMKGCGLKNARPVAQIVGSRLRLLFDEATRLLREHRMIDREELSRILHQALDYELTRLDIEVSAQLAAQANSGTPTLRLRFLDRSNDDLSIPQSNLDYGVDLGFLRAVYEEPSQIPPLLAKKVKETLGDIDEQCVKELLYGDLPPASQTKWQKKAVYLSQEVSKALGVAVYHVGKRIHEDKINYALAHEELATQHGYPLTQRDSSAVPLPEHRTPIDLSAPIQEAVSTVVQSLGLHLPQPKPIGEAVEEYKDAIRNNPKYKNGLDSTKRRTLDEIVLAVGKGTLTTSLTPQITERYCNLLHCLPKKMAFRKLRPDLWSYMTDKHDGPTIEDGTVRTRLISVSDFLNELARKNYISEKQAKDICRPVRERIQTLEAKLEQEKDERPFEIDELRKLFSPATYLDWSSLHAADFWVPLLGLFTGARMDELLTLRKMDIKQTPTQPFRAKRKDTSREGIWFIDLTDGSKKVKNDGSSRRIIPIHQFIIDAGFLNFIDDFAQEDFLFDRYLNPDKRDGNNKLTKEFTEYRRSLGIGRALNESEGPKLCFHTLRHNFINAFKDHGVSDTVNREIVGHSLGTGKKDAHTQSYEQRHTVEKLYDDGIRVLDCYLDQVPELHALKDSPWTKPASQRGIIPKRRPKKKG